MSQTYVIKVSAAVQEKVHAKDRRVKQLVLTGIVERAEQQEILAEELQKRGWEQLPDQPGKWRRKRGRVIETLDMGDMSVEAEVELEQTLERSRTIVVRGDRDYEEQERRRQREQTELEKSIAITEEEKRRAESVLQREIADELDQSEEERTDELNEVVRGVYAESLKRKARRLGTVTEVREGTAGQDYELVIKLTN